MTMNNNENIKNREMRVERIAGGVAHEFNNILAGIVGYTTLLKQLHPPLSSPYADLKSIEKLVMRGAELTKTLLAYSGHVTHQSETLQINSLIEEVISAVRTDLSEGIEIELQLDKDCPEISGDRELIFQAITSLCRNAGEAMPGGGKLLLKTERVKPGKDFFLRHRDLSDDIYTAIIVSDEGIGINDQIKPLIFEPFFSTKEDPAKRGMGLSLVLGVVRKHGGGPGN